MTAAVEIDKPQLADSREVTLKELRIALIAVGFIFIPIFGSQLGFLGVYLGSRFQIDWLPLGGDFFWNLGLFLTPYIPYMPAALIGLGSIFLFPTFLLGLFYYLYVFRGIKWFLPVVATLVLFAVIASPFLNAHRERCARHFQKAKAYAGQTVSKETFLQECGQPAFYKPVGAASHWVYTDGNTIVPVRFDENGNAAVSDNLYPLFD